MEQELQPVLQALTLGQNLIVKIAGNLQIAEASLQKGQGKQYAQLAICIPPDEVINTLHSLAYASATIEGLLEEEM